MENNNGQKGDLTLEQLAEEQPVAIKNLSVEARGKGGFLYIDGKGIKLNPAGYKMLKLLAEKRDDGATNYELACSVRDGEQVLESDIKIGVRQHIFYLRRKLNELNGLLSIESVEGVGYKLVYAGK